MMSQQPCDHLEDVESLALGLLPLVPSARVDEVKGHLASCEPCREEFAALSGERALFARRAEVLPAPPDLSLVFAREKRAAAKPESGAWWRTVSGASALVACAAAFVAVMRFSPPASTHGEALPDQPVMSVADETNEGTLACALFPASGVVRTHNEALSCVASSRLACEERVTSSTAGP
jgi:anti-sigma factor RsiW